MKNKLTLLATLFLIFSVTQVQATIISVSGSGNIIAAPTDVRDDAADTASAIQQGFNEMQGVVLGSALDVDGATDIAAGTVVDSHMIYLDVEGNAIVSVQGVEWTFSGIILGIMSDINGALEAASNSLLGAAGTTYYAGSFANRGLEAGDVNDNISISGNTLTLGMRVSEPGDWIRVITAHSRARVPEPLMPVLMLMGIAGLVSVRRGRKI